MYQRRIEVDIKWLTRSMLREMKTLSRLNRVKIIGITPGILRESIKLVLKRHIYLADALQILSAKKRKQH